MAGLGYTGLGYVTGAIGTAYYGGQTAVGLATGAAVEGVRVAAMSAVASTFKRPRHDDGEGASSRAKPQGVTLAHSIERWGTPRTMDELRRRAVINAKVSQWITYHFGRLSKSPLMYEGDPNTNLSYRLNYAEDQTLSVGSVLSPENALHATEFPLHIYSLSNRNWTSSNINIVGHYMYADSNETVTAGMCKFAPLTGVRADGSSACNDWNVWSSSDVLATNNHCASSLQSSILKDVRADFLLRGSAYNPTEFNIDLVYLEDESLGPLAGVNLTRDAFYLSLIRKHLGQPLASAPSSAQRRNLVRVLGSWRYFMPPSVSIEVDKTPPQRRVSIDINLHRRIQWNWRPYSQFNTKTNVDDPNVWTSTVMQPPNELNLFYPPNYRDRVFLIVRATNTQNNGANATPSYDLSLKTTHVWCQH